jgi:hypothetical protein
MGVLIEAPKLEPATERAYELYVLLGGKVDVHKIETVWPSDTARLEAWALLGCRDEWLRVAATCVLYDVTPDWDLIEGLLAVAGVYAA